MIIFAQDEFPINFIRSASYLPEGVHSATSMLNSLKATTGIYLTTANFADDKTMLQIPFASGVVRQIFSPK